MKLVKLLLTLAIINFVVVALMVSRVSRQHVANQQGQLPGSGAFNLNQYEATPGPDVPGVTAEPQVTVAPTQIPNPTAGTSTTPTPAATTSTPTPTPGATVSPTATPAPTPAPTPSGCIVVVDGVSYDVSTLRFTHSGGDVFICGTDMSQVFWSQHNQRIWNKLQKYRI